ncbi:unnamed protein product [Lota lota]
MGWVGLTHLFVLAMAPGLTKGCCQEIRHKRIPEKVKHPPRSHYRVVLGDPFVMTCVNPGSPLIREGVVWSRSRAEAEMEDPVPLPPTPLTREDGESIVSRENLLKIPAMTAELSGNYSCRTASGEGLDLQLQVLEETRLGCSELGPTQVTLTLGKRGEIYCPPSSCRDPELSDTQVTWYKGGRAISELQQIRDVCGEGLRLVLCTVYKTDSAVYSCDRHTRGLEPLWTTRRALNVKVIPPDTRNSPMILVPNGNRPEEVIGEQHSLLCKVKFGFERNFTPMVRWYSSRAADQAQMVLIDQQEEQKRENLSTHETLVTQVAVLPAVTELHLQHNFTCLATNAVGTNNSTTRLWRRDTAGHWLVGAVCPIVCVVLLTGLVVIVHLHNLELTLIYRSYWQSTNHAGDRKDIDVFLSHGWSHASEDVTGSHTSLLLSQSGEQGMDWV